MAVAAINPTTCKVTAQTRPSGRPATTVSERRQKHMGIHPADRYDTEVKLDLVTATAALAGVSSILFGLLTNLPVCLG
jgi:xanthine/uracil/vitamin C permease (AzgA family)